MDYLVFLTILGFGILAGLAIMKLLNPNQTSLKQIYLSRIARVHYYDCIETNNRQYVKEFYVKMNDGSDTIISSGVGKYIKPTLPEQEIIQGKRHIVLFDKKNADAYTEVNKKGELTTKYKFEPLTFELYFNPKALEKIIKADSIHKTLTPKKNENMQMMFYLLIGVVLLGALWIFFGQG